MAEQAEGRGGRAAVHRAIRARLKELGMTLTDLNRLSGVAPNTVRNLLINDSGAESTLVAMAAILQWPYPFDHLRNILHGESDENERPPEETQEPDESVMEERYRESLLSDIHQVKEDISELRVAFDSMDAKVNSIAAIMQGWGRGSGPPDQA